MGRARTGSVRGFTLLEMLLALSVAGLLLTYAAFQIVSLSTIWAHRADEDFFSEHADGVVRFLNASFERATAPERPEFAEGTARNQENANNENGGNDGENGDGENGGEENGGNGRNPGGGSEDADENSRRPGAAKLVSPKGVDLQRPPGVNDFRPPLFHFAQLEPPPLLAEEDLRGLPGIEAYLQFDNRRGLAILWYSPLLQTEDEVEEQDLRSTLLSPYVSQIDYIYRQPDTDRWDEYQELHEEGQEYTLPDFIRLTFTLGDTVLTRIIRIPRGETGIPTF